MHPGIVLAEGFPVTASSPDRKAMLATGIKRLPGLVPS
jgi:hypothetical protein